MSAVIEAVALTKIFRDFWQRARVRAVHQLDLQIEPGEIYGLLGPNGSGKSTTIKIILGLLHPSRGRVAVFGKPADDVRIKARIGYLPEESYMYRFLNARETLDYYGTLFQLPRADRRRRTEELLEMVGLRSAARRPVGEYSKGMQRRIGLAQALINDPDLLILDEPTSGLDPIGSKLVKDIIVRLGTVFKKTILLSSHLLADVEEVCSRVTILYGGQVQVNGRMEDVLAQRDRVQFTTDRLAPETIREIEEVIRRREGKQLEITTPKDRLESLFLRIVQQAHAEKVETGGAAATGDLAGFLGQQATGRAVLEQLVRAEPVAASAAPADAENAAKAAAVSQNVLAELVGTAGEEESAGDERSGRASSDTAASAAPTGVSGAPAVKRDAAQVDRSVLDELSKGG